MLNANSRKVLNFLKKHRPNYYTQYEIAELSGAEHAVETVADLQKGDYLRRNMDLRDGNVVAVYAISDAGMSVLEERRELISDRFITRAISIAALIISILALLSQLGILQLPQYSRPEKSNPACSSSSLTS